MIDDSYTMPFGKHVGKPLKDVPASYLLWFFEQSWSEHQWPELYVYVRDREDELLEECQAEKEDMQDAAGLDSWGWKY